MTTGGIYGYVNAIEDDTIWLDIAEGVEIRISKGAVAQRIPAAEVRRPRRRRAPTTARRSTDPSANGTGPEPSSDTAVGRAAQGRARGRALGHEEPIPLGVVDRHRRDRGHRLVADVRRRQQAGPRSRPPGWCVGRAAAEGQGRRGHARDGHRHHPQPGRRPRRRRARDHPPGQRRRREPARREGPGQGPRDRRPDRRAALPARCSSGVPLDESTPDTTVAPTTTVAGATTTVAGAATTVAGATTTSAAATTVPTATTTPATATTVPGATTTVPAGTASRRRRPAEDDATKEVVLPEVKDKNGNVDCPLPPRPGLPHRLGGGDGGGQVRPEQQRVRRHPHPQGRRERHRHLQQGGPAVLQRRGRPARRCSTARARSPSRSTAR